MKTQNPDSGCERSGHARSLYCFDSGDDRSNEQLQLAVMHTLWMREHNRIADKLYALNPHWSDEKLFQETRRIIGAMVQHITFNEFLPIVVGRKTMTKYGINLLKYDYYNGYDPKINPGIRVEFQASAFRFGHSILPDTTERYNKFHEKLGMSLEDGNFCFSKFLSPQNRFDCRQCCVSHTACTGRALWTPSSWA